MANTFNDYKSRISIMQVLKELGYAYDPSKGKTQPSFILKDIHGNETDRVYIKNPTNNDKAYWWRRTGGVDREYGDVVQLVKNNLSSFSDAAGARNETDALNRVLARLSNMPIDPQAELAEFIRSQGQKEAKPFHIGRYERTLGSVETAMKFLKERAITPETAALFINSIECIHDSESKFSYKNLAFPYTKAGTIYRPDAPENITGYEVRGFKGFKSKAEGSDSTRSCWQAYLGKDEHPDIEKIHFAESALDLMAYVQIRKNFIDFDKTLFVSVGGTFSDDQMKNLLASFPMAMPVLHFDNDINGVMYDCRTACLIAGKTLKSTKAGDNINFNVGEKAFSLPIEGFSYGKFRDAAGIRPRLQVEKAPALYKDWNDILITAMNAPKNTQKAEANEKMEVQYGLNKAGQLKPLPKDYDEDPPSRGFRR